MHRTKLADHPALMGVNWTWGAHKKISKHILRYMKHYQASGLGGVQILGTAMRCYAHITSFRSINGSDGEKHNQSTESHWMPLV